MSSKFPVIAAAAITLAAAGSAVAAPAPTAASGRSGQAAQTAAKQPVVSGFYEGKTVRYYNFGPIKLKRGNTVAPIWSVTNGVAGQHNIVDTVPGEKGYTPLWQLINVTWAKGKTPRLLTSADAVKKAAAAGEVTTTRTKIVVNCPILGFGQKKATGFSAGHVIRYYDLGPVKVAAGNAVVPLYTVTNGVAGQHNVAEETVGVGVTAYPPLWGILKVTWKPAATKHLLTSFAAIQKARTAGQVTVLKTSLVVNCPIV